MFDLLTAPFLMKDEILLGQVGDVPAFAVADGGEDVDQAHIGGVLVPVDSTLWK